MITNNSTDLARITYPYVWWEGIFSKEEIQKIVDYCESKGVTQSTTVQAEAELPQEDIRKSYVGMHSYNEETAWIFQRLNQAIETVNDQFYRFDLSGYDFFQYGVYHGEEQGKYDWHQDMILGSRRGDTMFLTRKLSISMLLNDDFEGGEFEMTNSSEATAYQPEMKPGRMIAFPSWQLHRVKPVTAGTRRSLVLWVMGPKFR